MSQNLSVCLKITIPINDGNANLLVGLIYAGVVRHTHQRREEFYLMPPKGTTDTEMWAKTTKDKWQGLGFAMQVVRVP